MMASRTGLIPIKTKTEAKTDRKSTTYVKKQTQTLRAGSSIKSGFTNIKMRTVPVKNVLSLKQKNILPVKHELTLKSVASKVSKNAVPVANKTFNKPVLATKSKVGTNSSHPRLNPVDRSLPKHSTPGSRSFFTGQRTPKSILKKEPSVPDTSNKRPSQVMTCSDSHHVKFRSKTTDQASMREKLNAWLEAKGKSKSVYVMRHEKCFNAQMSEQKRNAVLVDRTLSANVLSQQNKVLNNEAVKKKLFEMEEMPLSQTDKQKSPSQEEEFQCRDTSDKNHNAVTIEEAGDEIVGKENGGNPVSCQNNSFCANTMKMDTVNKIESMMEECLQLFNSGQRLEDVLVWLAELETNMPETLTFATYYLYKAKLLADFPQMVLDVYCEAVKNGAQPCELLVTGMKSYFSKWLLSVNDSNKTQAIEDHVQLKHAGQITSETESHEIMKTVQSTVSTSSCKTPKQASDKRKSNVHNLGSTVKYSIGSVKPLVRDSTGHANVTFVTPVRRSLRLSGKPVTPSTGLRREVNSFTELSSVERQPMLFKVNPAITGN